MEVNFATLALEVLMEDPRSTENMEVGPRRKVIIDALTKAGNKIAERLEKAEGELQTLNAHKVGWLAATEPGGWVDDLRKQVEGLKATLASLKPDADAWRVATEPGGWIGDLNKEAESLKVANANLERQIDGFDIELRKVRAHAETLTTLLECRRVEERQIRDNFKAIGAMLGCEMGPEENSMGFQSSVIRERIGEDMKSPEREALVMVGRQVGKTEAIEGLKRMGAEAERVALKGLFEELLGYIDVPERNCSCHISPPCRDCTENAGLREAVEAIEARLGVKA